MGFWSGLGKVLGVAGGALAAPFTGGASLIPAIAGAAGAGIGAIGQAKAQNRGEQFGGQMDLERLLMQREMMNQQGQSDAFRKLQAAQRVLNPGPMPQLSPYSVAPRQAGHAERMGADLLTQEVLARLAQGSKGINVDTKLLNPGWFEKFSSVASPALGFYGRMAQGQPRGQDVLARNPLIARNYLQQAPQIYG